MDDAVFVLRKLCAILTLRRMVVVWGNVVTTTPGIKRVAFCAAPNHGYAGRPNPRVRTSGSFINRLFWLLPSVAGEEAHRPGFNPPPLSVDRRLHAVRIETG